jgi:hypothetical protein
MEIASAFLVYAKAQQMSNPNKMAIMIHDYMKRSCVVDEQSCPSSGHTAGSE